MTEKPDTLLGVIVSLAGTAVALIGAGLVSLGAVGVAGVATTVAGALSACVLFVADLRDLAVAPAVLLLLLLISTLGFLRAAATYAKKHRLLARLPVERIESGPLHELARDAGLRHLYVLPAARPTAFCHGLLRPRVVVTAGLLERLHPVEREAVVWHEAHHARNREPLKHLLGRIASSTFFWIPALHDLFDRYLLVREIAADRLAVRRTSTVALAGALSEVAGTKTPLGAVGLSEHAAARVDRLFDADAPLPLVFRRSRLLASVVILTGLSLLIALSGPLSGQHTPYQSWTISTGWIHGPGGMALGFAANTGLLLLLGYAVRARYRRRSSRLTGLS